MKATNKFDKVLLKPIDFFGIHSGQELRSFLGAVRLGMMQTDGLEALKNVILDYENKINQEIKKYKQVYDFQTIRYLKSILEIFQEAKYDIQQTIWYKYDPLHLFNLPKNIDRDFIRFTILFIVNGIKELQEMNVNTTKKKIEIEEQYRNIADTKKIILTYQSGEIISEDMQKTMSNCCLLMFNTIFPLIKKDKRIFENVESEGDYKNIYRILYPLFNKEKNEDFVRKYDTYLWQKTQTSSKDEGSHITTWNTKRKNR